MKQQVVRHLGTCDGLHRLVGAVHDVEVDALGQQVAHEETGVVVVLDQKHTSIASSGIEVGVYIGRLLQPKQAVGNLRSRKARSP